MQQVGTTLVEKDRVRAFDGAKGEVNGSEFPSLLDRGFHGWLGGLAADRRVFYLLHRSQ